MAESSCRPRGHSHAFSPLILAICYLLALSWIISPVFAIEDNTVSTPQPGPAWPFYEGPKGVWDFMFAIVIAVFMIAHSFSAERWPRKFQDPALGLLLLGFCTFGGFSIMGDGTATLATLLR